MQQLQPAESPHMVWSVVAITLLLWAVYNVSNSRLLVSSTAADTLKPEQIKQIHEISRVSQAVSKARSHSSPFCGPV